MGCGAIVLITTAIVGIYLGILMQKSVWSLCESSKCPFCYGTDLCQDIQTGRIKLHYKSFSDLFYNLFSVKNTYFAEYDGVRVVLKKLAHQDELNQLEGQNRQITSALKTCNEEVAETFLNAVASTFHPEQISTIVRVNPEPLLLALLQDGGWPVPKLLGACGFVVAEEYCGLPLNHFRAASWHARASLALQLLEAAIDFTSKHADFRVYLTDISPDNVAVDDDFNLCFVDLENVILKQRRGDKSTHYSEFFDEDAFVYSEEAVCEGSVSDHNIYAVCRLLLSRRAPWPMMPGGLLHSPPLDVRANHGDVFDLVEKCVVSSDRSDRFDIAEELIRLLKLVINKA